MAKLKDNFDSGKRERKKPTRPYKKYNFSQYTPEFHDAAAVTLAEMGGTASVIAKGLDVSKPILLRWMKENPDFAAKVKEAKYRYDTGVVVKSLHKRAIGYDFIEVTREPRKVGEDPSTGEPKVELTVTKEVKKHIPADVTAAIFWLKNRNPQEWRDRHEVTGDDGGPLQVVIKHYAPQITGGESGENNGRAPKQLES